MKHLFRKHAIILAALLQVLPLVRNLVTHPAAGSSFAFILRWGIGAGAALGAFDSISRASAPVIFTTPTNFPGTVGSFFTNNVAITNNAGDAGAFFALTNKFGIISSALYNGNTTTSCLPAGLTFKCFDPNNGGSPKIIYGAIYGTPTTPITNLFIHLLVGYTNQTPAQTNIWITILPFSAQPPGITNHPASLTNLVGSNPTFSVTAGGTGPLSYQWFFNTNTALLNATNASLTLTNVQLTNAGYYRVAITNSAGATNSLNALLTVIQPPVITNSPAGFTTNVGGSATFSSVVGGSAPLKFQWYFNTTTPLLNATNATLTLTNLQTTDTGNYSFIVTNTGGAATSAPALLTVWQPPVITNQPAGVTNVAGGNAAFTVLAGGSAPLHYQWYFNTTTALPNATNTTLSLTGIRASQAGTYSVVIVNSGGALTSSPVLLGVTNPLPTVLTAAAQNGGGFEFTFVPVIGLTNSVLTTSDLAAGDWAVLTNVPPPASASPITVTDALIPSNRFYRVQIIP